MAYVGKKVVTVPADVKPYVVARRSQAFGSLETSSASRSGSGGKGDYTSQQAWHHARRSAVCCSPNHLLRCLRLVSTLRVASLLR
jgi:hypothetical protein